MTRIDAPALHIMAETVDGLEELRKATANRYRALTTIKSYGGGSKKALAAVTTLDGMLKDLEKTEKTAILLLKKEMREHPLNDWVQREAGVGEKTAARLLAAIGDPYWNDLHNRPRTVSELWAYCGYAVHDGTAQRRTKGQKSNWSNEAKMRTFLIAEGCVKMGKHYREVYDTGRILYAAAVHTADCVRCGPAGSPAKAGSPLSLGHQHARAMRLISKEILKDMWLEAKAWHAAHPTV